MQFEESRPNPASLVESMRDIGYSMETAIADIIDNSIGAFASEVRLDFSWNGGDPWLSIVDNGHGMSDSELSSAMRLGSQSPLLDRNSTDLGRFGLGMKTASFSQCRQLTVISRKSGIASGRQWDLDILSSGENHGLWPLRVLNNDEIMGIPHAKEMADSGTIVLWGKMDRLDNHDGPKVSEKKYNDLIDRTRRHLQLVFHRFLAGERGLGKLVISINSHGLEPFDPYNQLHPATQILPREVVVVNGGENITIQPFILPHHSKTSREDYEKHEGDAGYLRNQGFYVYRNKRLIIHGTWFRLARQEDLTKLARVQIDIPNSLDHLWNIDVKKSTANPPEVIRERLRAIINRIRETGSKVYRQKGHKLAVSTREPLWVRRAAEGKIMYQISRSHPLLTGLLDTLGSDCRQQLRDLIDAIESRFPTESFYNDAASKPEMVAQESIAKETLERLAVTYISRLRGAGMLDEEIPQQLLDVEPFSRSREVTVDILKNEGFKI
ncbi:ATP-binding protein [Mariprofundus ferrooxydans]|uniref:ATP-binding protein n=1 Tax=Mariprofundus ferrooxydans TaxID=314344 RepID=UPI00142F411F|nr:ATP-binding protein [Mariprofundus ferrooxydans]